MSLDVSGTQIQRRFWSILAILLAFSSAAGAAPACPIDINKINLLPEQSQSPKAKKKAYTEGLIFVKDGASDGKDALYESVGLHGQSMLRRIDLESSMDQKVRPVGTDHPHFDFQYFTKGIAEINHDIFQVIQPDHKLFRFTPDGADQELALDVKGDAWGLTSYDDPELRKSLLVLSDGREKLKFIDPDTLKVVRTISARWGDQKIIGLNELESANGYILANIYGNTWIAMINPINGCLEGILDLSAIMRNKELKDSDGAQCAGYPCNARTDFVANGIAYDPDKKDLYITGKNWPFIYIFRSVLGEKK